MDNLYHFTRIKGLIGIMRDDAIVPGPSGSASLTFRHDQPLFRYSAAVLVLRPGVVDALGLERHEGDAACLAGGDECEYRTAGRIAPVSAHLAGIAIRPNVLDEDAKWFRAQYGMGKKEFRALLEDWRRQGVPVLVADFNETDLAWHRRFAAPADAPGPTAAPAP